MSIVHVLKIMTYNNDTVLLSTNAIQSITPISEYKVIRNINNKLISQLTNPSLKCAIKTADTPNIDLLQLGEKYKIYSISKFKNIKKPNFEHIQIEKNNLEYIYKPVFEMVLVNFECTSDNDETSQQWVMQFVQA